MKKIIITSKKEHTRHHYIPQCYLRNFSDNGVNIYTYDKYSSTSYYARIEDRCTIDDFYRLSKGYIKENPQDTGKELFIECDYLSSNIEPNFSKIISWLISRKEQCLKDENKNIGLSFNDKKVIAAHIAIQYLRLPIMKTDVLDTFNQIMPQMIDLFKQGIAIENNDQRFNDLDITAHCDPALYHAGMTFMNKEFINEFAEILANNYWSFLVSGNGIFYTSDFPIVVEPHVPNVRPMYLGLAQYGAELTFPISKDIVITIWDKEYFASKRDSDCKFITVDAKEERRQNSFRYFYARRNVFSFHNDFKMIDVHKTINNDCHCFKGILSPPRL